MLLWKKRKKKRKWERNNDDDDDEWPFGFWKLLLSAACAASVARTAEQSTGKSCSLLVRARAINTSLLIDSGLSSLAFYQQFSHYFLSCPCVCVWLPSPIFTCRTASHSQRKGREGNRAERRAFTWKSSKKSPTTHSVHLQCTHTHPRTCVCVCSTAPRGKEKKKGNKTISKLAFLHL